MSQAQIEDYITSLLDLFIKSNILSFTLEAVIIDHREHYDSPNIFQQSSCLSLCLNYQIRTSPASSGVVLRTFDSFPAEACFMMGLQVLRSRLGSESGSI